MRCVIGLAIVLTLLLTAMDIANAAEGNHEVWFTPGEDTPDLVQLFSKPELWAATRAKVNVFQISPVLAGVNRNGRNGLEQLVAVGAFQSLRKWGIDLGLEAPAVKKWDCSAQNTLRQTFRMIDVTKRAGGSLKYIAMDEPLVASLFACNYTIDRAADLVSGYIKAIRNSDPFLSVGDVIAYPHFRVAEIVAWERMLAVRGAKPSFVHLDVDWNRLRLHPETDYGADFRALMRSAHDEGFPLGLIFWSGINPLPSSEAYFHITLNWVKRVHAAIGAPDHAVFESWVTRSSRECAVLDRICKIDYPRCGPADGPDCGQKSIPINLPDNDPNAYSHTRLISESLRVLGW